MPEARSPRARSPRARATAPDGASTAGRSRPAADGASPEGRSRLRRHPERGRAGFDEVAAVLDAGVVCHLALEVDGWPVAVPTSYGRAGRTLYVHGSVASRTLRTARTGVPACVTVTLTDGLVLARSVFNHSANYRCVMVFGHARLVEGSAKLDGLRAITEHLVPGQWGYARVPTEQELAQTSVLAFDLDEASAKVRSGPPGDGGEPDAELGLWAGEVPLRLVALEPVADSTGPVGTLPPHLAALPAILTRRLRPPEV